MTYQVGGNVCPRKGNQSPAIGDRQTQGQADTSHGELSPHLSGRWFFRQRETEPPQAAATSRLGQGLNTLNSPSLRRPCALWSRQDDCSVHAEKRLQEEE